MFKSFFKKAAPLIIFGLAAAGTGLWTIVEFILYLVKNDPFNWISLTLCIVFFVIAIIIQLMTMKKMMRMR